MNETRRLLTANLELRCAWDPLGAWAVAAVAAVCTRADWAPGANGRLGRNR